MTFINVGAYVNGIRPKSKAALRRALETAPETVRFDCTAMDQAGRNIYTTNIPAGAQLSVVGPDPYTSRAWYGTVKLSSKTDKYVVS